MISPKISVVMAVYNGADSLDKTIRSVLSQSTNDFEFIIVNDGSTDQSKEILERSRRIDNRVILISQENRGLTHALKIGCQKARGEFIARQDNGDISLSSRLKSQLEHLELYPNTAMVSCSTRFIAPRKEELYTVTQSRQEAKFGLMGSSVETLKGPPHHGSVMFRRSLYELVGGYRLAFKVAQDIDLWSRLIEHGDHYSLPDIMYQASVAKNSISMLRREEQLKATKAIIECRQSRQQIGNDDKALERYISSTEKTNHDISKRSDAAYYYFVGSNLTESNPEASRYYLRLALELNQWHLRARIKLIKSTMKNLSDTKP